MPYQRIVFETADKNFRIIEVLDLDASMEDLKGDCFNPSVNNDISEEKLREEEKHFEDLVNREGVFGYILERWNPSPAKGYEHIDSCFGFVGQYSPSDTSGTFDHYIVNEMKAQIEKLTKKSA